MNHYNYFIIFVIAINFLFVILSTLLFFINKYGNETDTEGKLLYWKERVEFIFIVNMSIILLYLFYTFREKPIAIDKESQILLFVYGILILLTAKWDLFISESKWFYNLQRIFGGNYYKKKDTHKEINYNIQKSENMRNLQDFSNQQNYSKSNVEYQKYYTLIYPPDTIGHYGGYPTQVAAATSNPTTSYI